MTQNNQSCECGCGQATTIAQKTSRFHGRKKDQPMRFIHGHNSRGSSHPQWKGGQITSCGYILLHQPEHPRANSRGYVREHILIKEKELGRYLTAEEIVHHLDKNPKNNATENLLLLPNNAAHTLLHVRERAAQACGNPDWRSCQHCQTYDDPANLFFPQGSRGAYHKTCRALYNKQYRQQRAEKALP